ELSRGTRTKLALLLAFCRSADLLTLDEPTSGLDPAMTEQVLQTLVSHVADGGVTVCFSSHQIAEVDQIADHVGIIDDGRTIVSGALDDLRERFCRVQLVFEGDAPLATFRVPGVERVSRKGRILSVLSSAGADAILAEARALNPSSVDVAPVALKDIFLETIGAPQEHGHVLVEVVAPHALAFADRLRGHRRLRLCRGSRLLPDHGAPGTCAKRRDQRRAWTTHQGERRIDAHVSWLPVRAVVQSKPGAGVDALCRPAQQRRTGVVGIGKCRALHAVAADLTPMDRRHARADRTRRAGHARPGPVLAVAAPLAGRRSELQPGRRHHPQ